MSDERSMDDREQLAAEYALGVLEGGERREAERLSDRDAAFAAMLSEWNERLAPLLDEIPEAEPDPALWERINRALDEEGGRASNVSSIERRLKLWRTYGAAVTAIAAALVLALVLDSPRPPAPPPQASQPQRQPMLVANVAAEDRSAAFVVSYDPAEKSLLVSPAVATPAPGHDHELWVIPASGVPQSLGLVASTAPKRLGVPASALASLRPDATLAISVEPVGGSPTGQPTGPVIATGKINSI